MKLGEIEGKTLIVVSISPWEIIFQEENCGMPGGMMFVVRPSDVDGQAFTASLDILLLRPEALK